MKDFMTIAIGDLGCATEVEVTVTYGDKGLRRITMGKLIDCWIKHHPDPLLDDAPDPKAPTLVGKNASKHLRAICKQNGIRSKDHS